MIDIKDTLNYLEKKYNRPMTEDEINLIEALGNLITEVWRQLDEKYAEEMSFESAQL